MIKGTETIEYGIKIKQMLRKYIWEFIKFFIVIINTIAAISSIVGLIISVVSKEKRNIIFLYVVVFLLSQYYLRS